MKHIKDSQGLDKVVHSLESLSYLKLDPINYMNFMCQ